MYILQIRVEIQVEVEELLLRSTEVWPIWIRGGTQQVVGVVDGPRLYRRRCRDDNGEVDDEKQGEKKRTFTDGVCLTEQAKGSLIVHVAASHFLFIGERREEKRRWRLAREGQVGHVRWCRREGGKTLRVGKQLRVWNRSYSTYSTA